MFIYGAALALVGKPKKRKLVCSFVKKENKPDESPINLGLEKSFTVDHVDLNNSKESKAHFKKFLSTIYEVIQLQAREGKQRVPVLLGVDGRMRYPIKKEVLPLLHTACLEFAKEQGIKLDELLSKIRLYKGSFTLTKHDAKGRRNISTKEAAKGLIKEYDREPYTTYNKDLEKNKAAIINGDSAALQLAERIAVRHGLYAGLRSKMLGKGAADFAILFPNHPDLQEIPFFNFWSWHPSIKREFRRSYAFHSGINNTVIVKGASDLPSPPFVDVLDCHIEDAHERKPPVPIPASVKKEIAKLRKRSTPPQ